MQSARAAVDLAGARLCQAEAALRLAELNLRYTQIRAPIRSVVTRRSAEVGAMISPDRPMLSLVPLDDVWVIANFKETQIEQLRPGQRAKIEVDAYHNRPIYGHVESVAGMSWISRCSSATRECVGELRQGRATGACFDPHR